jgi:hypothetical protein
MAGIKYLVNRMYHTLQPKKASKTKIEVEVLLKNNNYLPLNYIGNASQIP